MSAPEAGSLDVLRHESAVLRLYELLARSDGAAFKRLLPYLKDQP